MTKAPWTKAQDRLIRDRYPDEGASVSLLNELGEPAWRVRKRATQIGVRMSSDALKTKHLRYMPRVK